MTNSPIFLTVYATSSKVCRKVTSSYLILRNRGDDSGHGDIELSLENGSESIDTFLLRVGEREHFGPSEYTRICYKRADGHDDKSRLDIHAF